MTRVIRRERIPSTDVRLGRHVHHDSESRRYAFDTSGLKLASVRHQRRIPVLDQGQLGSCTGNAGIGALGTDPLYATVPSRLEPLLVGAGAYPFTEAGAVELYSDATRADDYPGQYPPTDTGSDGLTIAKVLKAHELISGYQHTFDLQSALLALTQYPLMVGTVWYQSMFTPSAEGVLNVSAASGVAGGHEFVVDEYDATRGMVGMTNSWGTGWGLSGRAYMQAEDLGALLAQQGDVIVLLPLTAPAPTPTPTPGPGPSAAARALAAALRHDDWVHHPHIGGNARVAHAALPWLAEEGL
jgi:hypothetical protein